MKKLIVMMLIAAIMAGCSSGDRIESAFKEYAKAQSIPNFNGISSIECIDTITFTNVNQTKRLQEQIDSTHTLLREKVEEMTEFFGNLSYSKKQTIALDFARIGAECGELWSNARNNHALDEFKDALDDLSPYGEPLYYYHIMAKVGENNISFYGFSCGEDVSFVKANDLSDAIRKNEKIIKYQDAMMNVIRTELVPHSILIDNINELMKK